MSISVLLADDQPLLRRGFRMILEAEGDLTVIAEAGDGEEAVEQGRRHTPDVVLMDIRMPAPTASKRPGASLAPTPRSGCWC